MANKVLSQSKRDAAGAFYMRLVKIAADAKSTIAKQNLEDAVITLAMPILGLVKGAILPWSEVKRQVDEQDYLLKNTAPFVNQLVKDGTFTIPETGEKRVLTDLDLKRFLASVSMQASTWADIVNLARQFSVASTALGILNGSFISLNELAAEIYKFIKNLFKGVGNLGKTLPYVVPVLALGAGLWYALNIVSAGKHETKRRIVLR